MHPLVAVVIVTWNNSKDIKECLQSVLDQDYPSYKVVLVDNNSSDNTAEIVMSQFPEVTVLAQTQNLFFAGGNNVGINYAIKTFDTAYVATLNPDTVVRHNWISAQIEVMEADTQIGVVGPKVLFAPGFGPDEKKSNPENMLINTVGILPGGFLFPYDRGYGEVDKGQYDKSEEVYALSGVSLMARTSVLAKVGTFFAPMQMYLEDVDLCLRIKKAGWKIIYTPTTVVYHKHMQSTKQGNKGSYFYWSRRNYLLLVWRHYSLRRFLRAIREVWKETGPHSFLGVLKSFVLTSMRN